MEFSGIKYHILRSGMKQSQVAQMANMTDSKLSRLVHGYKTMNEKDLKGLSKVLKVRPEALKKSVKLSIS